MYKIDVGRRIVFTAFRGAISFNELIKHAVALNSDPRFHTSFSELMDLRGVSDSELTFDELLELAHRIDPFSSSAHRAIVAGGELGYPNDRMYQPDGKKRSTIQVFRTMEEAWKWLRIAGDSEHPERQTA